MAQLPPNPNEPIEQVGIHGRDDRIRVTDDERDGKPFNATVAVDPIFPIPGGGGFGAYEANVGTGIAIGPRHVLTASHNFFRDVQTPAGGTVELESTEGRITPSEDVASLTDRFDGSSIGRGALNQGQVRHLLGYDETFSPDDDIALVTLDAPLYAADEAMGMLVFLDPTAVPVSGLYLETAGYPYDLPTEPTVGDRTPNDFNELYRSVGTYDGALGNRFAMSQTMDGAEGQSGSGVWTRWEALANPLVMGVYAYTGPIFNTGTLITPEVYYAAVAGMAADDGTANASQLPENTIVGRGDDLGFDPIDDTINGTYRKERLIGQSGDDTLFGAGADDRLEGGRGVDRAIYVNGFDEYAVDVIVDPDDAYEFKITHVGGGADGVDRLSGIETARFGDGMVVPLRVDAIDPTKLVDGPMHPRFGEDVRDGNGDVVGQVSVDIPSWSVDGDVRYTLYLGVEPRITYNFAYIIDVSSSMQQTEDRLGEAQAAYTAFTTALIANGIAASSTFSVISFAGSATLAIADDAQHAIDLVNGLTTSGGTRFTGPVEQAADYFENVAPRGVNVAFMLSDGQSSPSGEVVDDELIERLQDVAEVRAYGISASADYDILDEIDTDTATRLDNAAQLEEEFASGAVGRARVDRVQVLKDGVVVDVIDAGAFVDGPFGLTYQGEIDGLEVGVDARNDLEFRAIFNDGAPSASVDAVVTSGQSTLTGANPGGERTVTLGIGQTRFDQNEPGAAVIYGNDDRNFIYLNAGENTAFGAAGNDVFIFGSSDAGELLDAEATGAAGGVGAVEGGTGTDVARFAFDLDAVELTRRGEVVQVGDTATLTEVEYAEFDDAIVDLSMLDPVNRISVRVVEPQGVREGGYAELQIFQSDVDQGATLRLRTEGETATEGEDFRADPEDDEYVFVPRGEKAATVRIPIFDDAVEEGPETFRVILDAANDEVFGDFSSRRSVMITIEDDESSASVRLAGGDTTVLEGDPGAPNPVAIDLERTGDLSERETVTYAVTPYGGNPATAADFGGVLPTGEVVFEAGASEAEIAFDMFGDEAASEGVRSFALALEPGEGGITTPGEPTVFYIADDDLM